MAIMLPKIQREIKDGIQKTLVVNNAKKRYNYFTRQWEYVKEEERDKSY